VTAALDATLAALASPRRRRMVELLAERPRRASELATALGALRPAISRDLRVLRACGLVEDEPDPTDGRARLLVLRPAPLLAVEGWAQEAARFWSDQLGSLAALSAAQEEEGSCGR
jgi:DNA-binding transcriptional ArsR family regulator